ncbi:DUF6752 domain-containing protein [Nocardioides lianchengensis]|uniref:DUF6752 domain-containing protein n=1 Tax=Nocardioides lianchengensis TaxID=1045774 RepID=A0A1G6JZP1_9ACTN|nr:DUF6752 domain-containing protein [Nocardioides lianchengensis]NYG08836.1 hypothetical protein [Nocardioides lianchengensis]SDC24252.1 hypothetical protein SAMN05421872_101638 [Nocardioides lianchengensis]
MESLKNVLNRRHASTEALEARVRVLEQEVQECRQLNVRLAELCDVVTELLLPVADRDEATVRAVLEKYRADVGDPLAR